MSQAEMAEISIVSMPVVSIQEHPEQSVSISVQSVRSNMSSVADFEATRVSDVDLKVPESENFM
jgi:hypothetical protein